MQSSSAITSTIAAGFISMPSHKAALGKSFAIKAIIKMPHPGGSARLHKTQDLDAYMTAGGGGGVEAF
jgi:hypothetical protein